MARADRKAAAAESAKTGIMTHKQILFVLFGLMAGMFLSALDQSVVGTAMRTIADDLNGLSAQAWVTTAYLITSTIATPIYGKLGDIFGRRYLFITAISVFIFGSVICGFAGSMYELAAFRAIQGIGAGGLFALALTILADIVPPRERARYQGMFLAVFGTSSVLGPLIGGLLAGMDSFIGITGWRWIFLMNLPIGLIALALVVSFLHVPHQESKSKKIDWWGVVTIIIGVVPLLIVAEQGREWGWTSWNVIAAYVIGVFGITTFIWVEKKMGDDAILPLHLFKSSTFSLTTLLGVIIGIGMFGGMISLPLVLQIVYGATPTEAGYLMIPMVMGLMTASIVSGRITGKTGKYKIFMIVGTACMAVAYVYLSTLSYQWQIWQISIGMVLMGLGLGQMMQTLTIASQNAVEAKDIGVATSSSTFFRQMGGTLGVAVFLSILFNTLADKGEEMANSIRAAIAANPALLQDPNNAAFLEAKDLGSMIQYDSSFLKTASPELANPIKDAFAQSAATVFVSASFVVVAAFALSWFIKELALRTKSGVQEKADQAAAAMH
ncbi:MAG: DHA2 family efflux MFS transporter permease subunit [Micrococcales bacterium]|nr:DHA2 family efflux MFS transporter permease subunit [Micrococcales bacterium]